GRINNFLNVNSEVAGLAKVGPVRRQADSIMEMMREPSTRVHLVTILEEMPVQESLDAIAALEDDRLNVGHIIMNMVRADLLSAVTSRALESPTAPAELASTLDANGLDGSVAPRLWQAGHAHEQRQALQEQQRELVGEAGPPAAELPRVDEGVDAGRLYEFAETLVDQEVLGLPRFQAHRDKRACDLIPTRCCRIPKPRSSCVAVRAASAKPRRQQHWACERPNTDAMSAS